METIGDRIKQLRNEFDLNQVDFGAKVRLTGSAISQIESGNRSPSERTIEDICERFGISRAWLAGGAEPKYEEQRQDSPGALVPDLVSALKGHPTLLDMMKKVVRHMKPSDWDRLNQLLDDMREEEQP